MIEDVTFVIIGKNEGLHLARTFQSVLKITDKVIFVDSDSTDNSVEIAKSFAIQKIIRVSSTHGTAALSRSKGAEYVTTKYIQFLDGDETISQGWLEKAIRKLDDNKKIAGVHGYKKVYKKNDKDFFILSDKKDWEPDYLQGAVLINRAIYETAGGMETRIFGEEERDLYVRVKSMGYQIWYIHELMASHYDWKQKNLKQLLFGRSSYTIWIPLIKAIKNGNFRGYLFVYRLLLPVLFIDIICAISIIFGIKVFLILGFCLQVAELVYCFSINRKGYFFIWKAGILNFYRLFNVYRMTVNTHVEIIT
jgi:glycosyltransferase involved in cell wall biosynthesis